MWGTSDHTVDIIKWLLTAGAIPTSPTAIYSVITASGVQVPGLAGNPVGEALICVRHFPSLCHCMRYNGLRRGITTHS